MTRIAYTAYDRHVDNSKYITAIEKAGGEAVILDGQVGDLETFVKDIDGIVFTGGSDIDPALYGKTPDKNTGVVRTERDIREIDLVHLAIEKNIPTLGVCRGIQIANVALGGTIIGHLRTTINHKIHPRIFDCTDHEVVIFANSLLYKLYSDTDFVREISDGLALQVNSSHHQAVGHVGIGLKVVACAQDRTIEALEYQDHPFFVCVQWHPEDLTNGKILYEALIKAANKTAGEN